MNWPKKLRIRAEPHGGTSPEQAAGVLREVEAPGAEDATARPASGQAAWSAGPAALIRAVSFPMPDSKHGDGGTFSHGSGAGAEALGRGMEPVANGRMIAGELVSGRGQDFVSVNLVSPPPSLERDISVVLVEAEVAKAVSAACSVSPRTRLRRHCRTIADVETLITADRHPEIS